MIRLKHFLILNLSVFIFPCAIAAGIYGKVLPIPDFLTEVSNNIVFIHMDDNSSSTHIKSSGKCTGVFLDNKHILTAAHCVLYDDAYKVANAEYPNIDEVMLPINKITLYSHKYSEESQYQFSSYPHKYTPVKVSVPESAQFVQDLYGNIFPESSLVTNRVLADFAIITIKESFDGITLTTPSSITSAESKDLFLFGYGKDDSINTTQDPSLYLSSLYPTPPVLKYAPQQYHRIPDGYGDILDMLNLYSSANTLSPGDSGGPIIIKTANNKYQVLAVVSGRLPTESSFIYTNTSYYSAWIESQLKLK